MEAEVQTLEEGMRFKIQISVKPGVKARFLQGSLIIQSEHEDLKKKRFRFMGLIGESGG